MCFVNPYKRIPILLAALQGSDEDNRKGAKKRILNQLESALALKRRF